MPLPTSINRHDDGSICITWDDATQSHWTPAQLRQACPCATCREKKRKDVQSPQRPMVLPVISAAEARPLRIDAMRPVGNYAYNIAFSDGHNSGIFSFTMLKRSDVG